MNNSDEIFNLLFGWGFVIIAILLLLIFIVALKSVLAFNNAKIIKGKVVDLTDLGELNMPTIEYELQGKIAYFKTKTYIENLQIGQEIDLELASTNEVRVFDSNSSTPLPKVLFVVVILFSFFSVKGYFFLQTLFM